MKTAREILKENRLLSSYWGRRIVKAEERGAFNLADKRASGSWTTCACGKQDPLIPRGCFGAPNDSALGFWGVEFCGHVLNDRFPEAASALVKIERRAAEVLRELARNECRFRRIGTSWWDVRPHSWANDCRQAPRELEHSARMSRGRYASVAY